MFDPDIIDGLNTHERHMLRAGIDMILSVGIVRKQREASFARLFAGSTSEEPEVLAERIIQARVLNTALDSIEQLGEQLKEQYNESEVSDDGIKL